jgi:hypothetical protein
MMNVCRLVDLRHPQKEKKKEKGKSDESPDSSHSIKSTATSYNIRISANCGGPTLVLVWRFKRAVLIRRLQRPSLLLSRVPRSCNSLRYNIHTFGIVII